MAASSHETPAGRRFSFNGAAPESNRPSRGLHDLTDFEVPQPRNHQAAWLSQKPVLCREKLWLLVPLSLAESRCFRAPLARDWRAPALSLLPRQLGPSGPDLDATDPTGYRNRRNPDNPALLGRVKWSMGWPVGGRSVRWRRPGERGYSPRRGSYRRNTARDVGAAASPQRDRHDAVELAISR
jgi:hypothetical protein